MALDTDRRPSLADQAATVKPQGAMAMMVVWALRAVEGLGAVLSPAWTWLAGTWIGRFFTANLLRRILLSNLIGLAVLLIGISWLSQSRGWLIDSKVESLRIQAQIVAAAIAGNATVDTERIVIDPDRLQGAGGAPLVPYRDDAFAALELSMAPERVTPILRKLILPTATTRARVYDRVGNLVFDSDRVIGSPAARPGRPPSDPEPAVGTPGKLTTKNLWTRITHWFLDKELQVYKEIGSANGQYYPEVRAALKGASTPMLLLNESREQIVSVAEPIRRFNSVQGVLLMSTRPGEIDEILNEEQSIILTLALMALTATILTSLFLARTVAGPMRRLSATAELVSHNINARQDLPEFPNRRDEVGQMASAFRAMTAALYRRIEASEKFAADVAHELKNPLTAARSTAESLSFAKTPEQRDQLVAQIQIELKRLNRLISDVSNASRLDAELALQSTEPVALGIILENVVAIFRDKAETIGVGFRMSLPQDGEVDALVVDGHEGRLAQVVTNLVDNALSFSPEGRFVTVTARREDTSVVVIVDDEGPGIDEDKLDKVFERFYTYRPTAEWSRGNNSGLGLSITREIVRAHRGQVYAENRYAPGVAPGGPRLGARFVLRLPALPRAAVPRLGRLGGRRS